MLDSSPMCKKPRISAGISLLELLIALVVISILGGAAHAAIENSAHSPQIEARILAGAIREAEIAALRSGVRTQLTIFSKGYQYNDYTHNFGSSVTTENYPLTLSFYPTGAASPTTVVLLGSGKRCTITISLRGRLIERC
jgi:type II secretory pathway pseudopilin PulG